MATRRLFQYHPILGHTYIPGLRARVPHESGGYLLECNNAGFRSSQEFIQKKPRDVFRILIFGDSFTAGEGVSNKYRYSDLLPTLLGDSVEVYNFALSGTGTDQQYLCYQQFAQDIEADLVVLGINVENIRRVVSRYRPFLDADDVVRLYPKPWYSLRSDGSLQLNGTPVSRHPVDLESLKAPERAFVDHGGSHPRLRHMVRQWGNWPRDALQRLTHYQPLANYDSAQKSDWILMRSILEHWIGMSHTPVVLFPIPIHQYVEKTANSASVQARFQEIAADLDCILVDPLPELWRMPRAKRRSLRFEYDLHPTRSGHEALARALSKSISELSRM